MANGPFGSQGVFYVRDLSGNFYQATFLTLNGSPVVDQVLAAGLSPYGGPNLPTQSLASQTSARLTLYADPSLNYPFYNSDHYMVALSSDSANAALALGQSTRVDPSGMAFNFALSTFFPHGPNDPQYQYTTATGQSIPSQWNSQYQIGAMTDFGNYRTEIFGFGAGVPESTIQGWFGWGNKNLGAGGRDQLGGFGLSTWAAISIDQAQRDLNTTVGTGSDPYAPGPSTYGYGIDGAPVGPVPTMDSTPGPSAYGYGIGGAPVSWISDPNAPGPSAYGYGINPPGLSPSQYLIQQFQNGAYDNQTPTYQFDAPPPSGYPQYAQNGSNITGVMNDAGGGLYAGAPADQLSTFGTLLTGFDTSLAANNSWLTPVDSSASTFTSTDVAGVSVGTVQGGGGNDAGTTTTTVVDTASSTSQAFDPNASVALNPSWNTTVSYANNGSGNSSNSTASSSIASAISSAASSFASAVSSIASSIASIFSGGSTDNSGGDGGGDGGGNPVILDLAGTGIKIAPLSSSNTYYDMAGDGYQHRTAWAGAGNGVLVLDLAGNGQITQRNQIVFTDWDPTAKTDLQALADVFDTNHNGLLDAGDAQFANLLKCGRILSRSRHRWYASSSSGASGPLAAPVLGKVLCGGLDTAASQRRRRAVVEAGTARKCKFGAPRLDGAQYRFSLERLSHNHCTA